MTAATTGDWSGLVAAAILGTDRAPAVAALPPALTGIGPRPEGAEPALLEQVALLSVWTLAGQGSLAAGDAPAGCGPDARSPAWSLSALLAPGHSALLPEWCALAEQAGRRVPDSLLPPFLDLMAREKDPDKAAAMGRVLGRRGEWLARQNPAWSELAPCTDLAPSDLWETGTRAERTGVLRRLRAAGAGAESHALIASTLAQDPPADVAAFVAELARGLSMADHDALEALLDSRHKPVRQAAARLLGRLPGSARASRMAARLEARLDFRPATGGVFRRGKAAITVQWLEEADGPASALARDGVEASRARGTLGPKASVLAQIVAGAPLGWFSSRWGVGPTALMDAAREGDGAEALLQGWAEASVAQQDGAWAEALLGHFAAQDARLAGALLAVLSPERRESMLTGMLRDHRGCLHLAWMQGLLRAADHDWSKAFSDALLSAARRGYLAQVPWTLRASLLELAGRLAPGCLAGLTRGWPTDDPRWTAADSQMLESLTATLELRRQFHEELKP